MKLDLTDSELDELDELLAQAPEPLQPMNVLMLDGFLCGVLVQPRLIPPSEWMPEVFGIEAETPLENVDPAWRARCAALIERRHSALNVALAEDGWFDPMLVDLDREPPASEYDKVQAPHSRALLPWVVGFNWAQQRFPALEDDANESIGLALARIYRHLPAETDEARELLATLDREHPLASVDEAVEDLVSAVADLWDLTSDARFHVKTIRRDVPKVGRNDPCPCGSGRKYKQCHGAG
jgi:uncharacterized protein